VKVFIDTSAFYALADAGDRNHKAAGKKYLELLDHRVKMILTDHILAECATLIRRRLGYNASERFLQLVEKSETIGTFQIVFVEAPLLNSAKEIFSEFADPKLSLVDALSFAAMRKMNIGQYFAFDNHFNQAGFEPA
jgi:predicted nucleic acid-binding protein